MKSILSLALLLLLPVPLSAGELVHQVAPEETLGDIAQVYYGDPKHADVIRFYNGLRSTSIQTGSELRIPVVEQHIVSAGESWSVLALRYWKDAALHRELADYCSGSADARLRVGQSLRIPVLVPYRLQNGETLAAVSRRFYGHPNRAESLARFNRVKDPKRLQVGARLRVPISELGAPPNLPAAPAEEEDLPQMVEVTPEVEAELEEEPEMETPPEPEPAQLPESVVQAPIEEPEPEAEPAEALPDVAMAPPTTQTFEEPLRRAVNQYLDGRYDDALQSFEELKGPVLADGSRDEQATLLRYLTFVYTAFDRNDRACESYLALREVEPSLDWDSDEVSPKILQVVAGCDGG